MTAVEFLAERYNYITWMRNRDEISAGTADEWRAKFLKEAKEMEEQQLNDAWQEGACEAQNDAAKYIGENMVHYQDIPSHLFNRGDSYRNINSCIFCNS